MPASARLAADRITFRDTNAESVLQLRAVSDTPGAGEFTCQNGSNGTKVSITGIATPTADDGIANKGYVDSVASGLDMKGQVDYICHGKLMKGAETYTYDSTLQIFRINGVGSWFDLLSDAVDVEDDANGDPQTIAAAATAGFFVTHVNFVAKPLEHYYEVTPGDSSTATQNTGVKRDWPTRVLVNNEDNALYNGIYWLKDDGTGDSSNWVLQRTSNFDGNPNGEVKAGGFVFVADGHRYANKGFVLQQDRRPNMAAQGGFTLTTDGIDGNEVVFDGFSAAGFPHDGTNIVITGDSIATTLTPGFDNATIGELGIATVTGNSISVANGLHLKDTKLDVDKEIRCLNKISAVTGFEVKAGGDTAVAKFSVNSSGVTDIHGITHIRGASTYLHDCDLYIQDNTSSLVTTFSVTHASGDTTIGGTLAAAGNTDLGTTSGKSMIKLDNNDQTLSIPIMYLYGNVKVIKSNDDVLFDIAHNTGNTTISGSTTLKANLSVKNGQTTKFLVKSASGNTEIEGSLKCKGGSSSNDVILLDAAQTGDQAVNLVTYTSDKDLDIRNSAEATIFRLHPGTSPKLSLHQDATFELYNSTATVSETETRTVFINGSTGETKLFGISAHLSVGSGFKAFANTGDVTMAALTATTTATITSDVSILTGKLTIGAASSPRLLVHEANVTDDHICNFRGAGDIKVYSATGVEKLTITGDSGNMQLLKGATLKMKSSTDATHFEINNSGNVTTHGGNIVVKNVTGNAAVEKFKVVADTGNTTIEGTLNLSSELCAKDGILETSGDLRVLLDSSNSSIDWDDRTLFFELTESSSTYKTGDYSHIHKTSDDTTRYSLMLAGDFMRQTFYSGKTTIMSSGASPYTVFEVNAEPTANASPPQIPLISLCGNASFKKTDGTKMVEVITESGQIKSRGTFMIKSGADDTTATTTILADGTATFKNNVTIDGNTTIENDKNLKLQTGKFIMLGTGGTDELPKYEIDASANTQQHGTLTVRNSSLDPARDVFNVNMSGNVTAYGTLTASDSAFQVMASGNTQTTGTLDVGSTSKFRGTFNVVVESNGADVTKCFINTSGDIDTVGKLDVDGLATFSKASGNGLIVEAADVKFKYNTDDEIYKTSFDANSLATFTHVNQSMILQESVAAGSCIEMTTADSSATTAIPPSLSINKGALFSVKDVSASPFMEVDATARTVTMDGTGSGKLQFVTSEPRLEADMTTGTIKTQGDIHVYPSLWTIGSTAGANPNFVVIAASGNTVSEGTLVVKKSQTITEGNLNITLGSLNVQTDKFQVHKTDTLATFKGDDPIYIKDSSGNNKWHITPDSGSLILYAGSSITMRQATAASSNKVVLNGNSGNITSSGSLSVAATNFVVQTSGNTVGKGTLDVHKKVTLKGATDGDGLEIESSILQVKKVMSSHHKFAVPSGSLAQFVQANGADELLTVEYHDGVDSATTKFSISGQHGHTKIHGGNFSVTQTTVENVIFRVHQSEAAAIRMQSFSNTSAMVIYNTDASIERFKVVMNTGALTHNGTFTHTGDTFKCESKFEISGSTDSRTIVVNYENDDDDTDFQRFLKIFADTNHIVIGGTDEVTKMMIGTSTGTCTSAGDLVLRNQIGQAGVDKCKIVASSGNILTSGSVTLDTGGSIQIDTADSPPVTTFKVTGSNGNIATNGSITVDTNKWQVLATGSVYQREKFEIGDGTNTKFQVLHDGKTTVTGGFFKVQNSAGTVTLFKIDQPDQENPYGKMEFAGNLAMDGELSIGTVNTSDAAFKVESDGDSTWRGGDLCQYTTTGTKTFEMLAATSQMNIYGNCMTTGSVTGSGTAQYGGAVSALQMLSTSDERLKHRIEKIDGTKTLKMCSQMQAYSFEWRNTGKHGSGKQFGFIAQKIKDVHPALTATDEQGFYKVNYDIVTALTTTSVTELHKQINEMKAEMNALKAQADEATAAAKAATEAVAKLLAAQSSAQSSAQSAPQSKGATDTQTDQTDEPQDKSSMTSTEMLDSAGSCSMA